MQETRRGNAGPAPGNLELVLGRCMVDGDLEATSRARRTRRKTFGVSLTIEILLLGLLVAAPLLTSGAQPQLHQILPPQLTFFGSWHEHSRAQHVVPPTRIHNPQIPNPIQQTHALGVTPHVRIAEEAGDEAAPYLPEGYMPG